MANRAAAKTAAALSGAAIIALSLTACGGSNTIEIQGSATDIPVVDVEAQPEPLETVTEQTIQVKKGKYFAVAMPEGYGKALESGEDLSLMQDFDAAIVAPADPSDTIDPNDITSSLSEQIGGIWKAKKTGTTDITITYVDPETEETYTTVASVTVN